MKTTLLGAAALIAVLATGCFPTADDRERCTPGRSTLCTCEDGAEGVRVCDDEGYFEPCSCEAPDGGPGVDGGEDQDGGSPGLDGGGGQDAGTPRDGGQALDGGAAPDAGSGCAPACAPEAICDQGICLCPSGRLHCAGACVDLTQDPDHCGGCGIGCVVGEVCTSGECLAAPDCRSEGCTGLTFCDAADGLCKPGCELDAQCDLDEVCDPATHACTCPAGLTPCDGACVDTTSSASYCGSCLRACNLGEVCIEGQCQGQINLCLDYDPATRLEDCSQADVCDGGLECTQIDPLGSVAVCLDKTPCGASPTARCCGAGEFCGTAGSFLGMGATFCCVPGETLPGLFFPAACEDAGLDLGCTRDAECPEVWGRPYCQTALSPPRCVACRTHAHCGGGARCEATTGTCVECLTNTDCGAGQVCDAARHTCMECASDADCSGPTPACDPGGACVACTADRHCTSASRPYCDTAAAACVACTSGADCPAAAPVCEAGVCKVCPDATTCTTLQSGARGCYPDSPFPFDLCAGLCFDLTQLCGAPAGLPLNCVYPCP